MILHYIQISLRNLRKYKTQTAISIAAMSVSLTLMGIVSSIMLIFKPFPFLHQPYTNRVEQLAYAQDSSTFIDNDDMQLIANHHFKNAEKIQYVEASTYFMNVTSDPGSDDKKSLSAVGTSIDKDFLKFIGSKSAITGERIASISQNEVIISDWLAKKLFKDANPIGRYINLEFSNYDGAEINQQYKIKDVVEIQNSVYSPIPARCQVFLLADNLTKNSKVNCFFILKEGASRDSLLEEVKEIIPEGNAELQHMSNSHQDENRILSIRNFVILFLFLFVLLSFSNYLRQQTQLFRLREREVALRTCVGGNPKSLFFLFTTEIMIVLLLTLAIAVALVSIVVDYFIVHFSHVLDSKNIDFYGAIPITILTAFILVAISMIVVGFTIRRIRRDQTGLALRMRPQPKHQIRNVGLTVQLSISILFIWISVLFFMSIRGIKEDLGIPDNAEKFQRCLTLITNGISKEERDAINEKIESLKSIEKVYHFYSFTTYFNPDSYDRYSSQSMIFFQTANDVVDFFELDVNVLPGSVNPEKNVLINEEFKKVLIDQNLWNGKTVTMPFNANEQYEVKGVFNGKTLSKQITDKTIIVTDAHMSDSHFDRIILPKKGKERETKDEIESIFKEVCPSRIDLRVENWFDYRLSNYSMFLVMIVIVSILSVISVITTMACIYSAVSLDTRRRRKEMALRKLNGATPKVIAMIFARTYIWIIAVAILLTIPSCFIIYDFLSYAALRYIGKESIWLVYMISVLFVISMSALTIFWKIRDIMHADPIAYLKE